MTDLSIPFSRLRPNALIYTSGYAFQDAVVYHAKSSVVTISTFNVSTNIETDFLPKLCTKAIAVKLLVGTSPYNENNPAVLKVLHTWNNLYPNLTIVLGQKVHVKTILISQPNGLIGWAGSLNLITPTLHDLMVRLSKKQATEVETYIQQLWKQAQPL